MLNFSKINVFLIYFLFLILCFFSFLNLQKENQTFLDKKINLGLDLQGGSYLLLEIDTEPLIKERLQNKVIPLKKLLKENKINYIIFLFILSHFLFGFFIQENAGGGKIDEIHIINNLKLFHL